MDGITINATDRGRHRAITTSSAPVARSQCQNKTATIIATDRLAKKTAVTVYQRSCTVDAERLRRRGFRVSGIASLPSSGARVLPNSQSPITAEDRAAIPQILRASFLPAETIRTPYSAPPARGDRTRPAVASAQADLRRDLPGRLAQGHDADQSHRLTKNAAPFCKGGAERIGNHRGVNRVRHLVRCLILLKNR